MNSISRKTLEQGTALLQVINTQELGDLHSVTFEVEQETGTCVMTVAGTQGPTVNLLIASEAGD